MSRTSKITALYERLSRDSLMKKLKSFIKIMEMEM